MKKINFKNKSKQYLKYGYMSSMELLFCMPFVFFDFKAIGADKRVDYRGGTIKNH